MVFIVNPTNKKEGKHNLFTSKCMSFYHSPFPKFYYPPQELDIHVIYYGLI